MLFRRQFLKWTTLAAAASASGAATAEGSDNKVVYHLDDREKIAMALGNLQNHFKAFGDGQVSLAIVVIGEALGEFRVGADYERNTAKLRGLVEKGLTPYACVNTMAWLKLTLAELAPGFQVADKGGVVKLAELQRKGFAYIRP